MAKGSVIKIGIMPQHEMRARALAIARGEYKPKAGDPKVWFPSMRSLAEVLSDKNRDLLRAIAEQQPRSVNELARMTKRAPGNLSRTLHTLEGYGLVELKKTDGTVRPVAKATRFEIRA